MDLTHLHTYGTNEAIPPSTRVELGALALSLGEGCVRCLCWNGVELIRGITYPVRDENWGTIRLVSTHEELNQTPDGIGYVNAFTGADGAIQGEFRLNADRNGLVEASVSYVASRDFLTNRAGFTLLHPIRGLAGQKMQVHHSDGTEEVARFPEAISPAQPARDVVGLGYSDQGQSVSISMSGDIFEMEDQRNWTDASYKTYCRPFALPKPFWIGAGETLTQSISIRMSGSAAGAAQNPSTAIVLGAALDERLPEICLVGEKGWALPPAMAADLGIDCIRHLVRLDLDREEAPDCDWIAAIRGGVDLELVVPDDGAAIAPRLAGVARALEAIDRLPERVVALPAAFLDSYQPDEQWPTGATPKDAAGAARTAFSGARVGGGMLTNFTEFNRCPPHTKGVDYVTFGSTAIVHAADDQSVFQTLEALPQVFSSAQLLAGGKPIRLGLVSIGMRTNPYGDAVMPNPHGARIAMAGDDPRAHALYGAAWLVGMIAATQNAGLEAVAVGAPAGPFGIVRPASGGEGRLCPSYHVTMALKDMHGMRRIDAHVADPEIHVIAASGSGATRLLIANGSSRAKTVVLPKTGDVLRLDPVSVGDAALDRDWRTNTTLRSLNEIDMPPCAVAFVSMTTSSEVSA